ncbi:MAG: thermonuclease family protein [Candidatus Binatia bacterium]
MPILHRRALTAALLALLVHVAVAAADTGERALVTRVADGDTVRVQVAGRELSVRLIGVDAPEMGFRGRPGAPPQPFAREATAFARRTLDGRRVRLEFETGDRLDKYGRTLAYVFLDDGTFFNRELIRQGYARALARYPFRYRKQFLADEAAARQAKRGLWADVAAPRHGPVIGNVRSRIYHVPGQPHYDDVAPQNRVYFANEQAARAAGYRPARGSDPIATPRGTPAIEMGE